VSQLFNQASAAVKISSNYVLYGTVTDVRGLVIEGTGPFVPMGSKVTIQSGVKLVEAQVVGFNTDRILMMPFEDPQGISPGATIMATEASTDVLVSDKLLGRVIDGSG
jgi:flagellum-specific ATP synthase